MEDETLDFKKICRTCLGDAEPMKDISEVCSADVFKYCTSVEIPEEDLLPRQMCQTCVDTLNKLYYFKQLVIRSNIILRQQLSVQVKTERRPNENSRIIDVNLTETNEAAPALNHSLVDNENHVNKRKKSGTSRAGTRARRPRMKCVKCDKSFQKYENLEAHMRGHFGKKIKYQLLYLILIALWQIFASIKEVLKTLQKLDVKDGPDDIPVIVLSNCAPSPFKLRGTRRGRISSLSSTFHPFVRSASSLP